MKFTTTIARIFPPGRTPGFQLVVEVPKEENVISGIDKICKQDKPISVEIKVKREGRSLSANGMAWSLIDQIAKKMGSTSEEIYLIMLERYGVKEYSAIPKGDLDLKKKAYKIVEIIENVLVNGKPWLGIMTIRGSSTYDTKEFSVLLEGIISEAKELGIETATPNEIAEMMAIYEQNYKKVT